MTLCECGCGQLAKNRFVLGHNALSGEKHQWWTGGRKNSRGYIMLPKPDHPRAGKYGYVLEHVLIAEKAVGRYLPEPIEIHHVNEKKDDNRNSNLVICNDKAYHKLLHKRMRAFKGCGHANWKRCQICHQWDNQDHLYISPNTYAVYHRECMAKR